MRQLISKHRSRIKEKWTKTGSNLNSSTPIATDYKREYWFISPTFWRTSPISMTVKFSHANLRHFPWSLRHFYQLLGSKPWIIFEPRSVLDVYKKNCVWIKMLFQKKNLRFTSWMTAASRLRTNLYLYEEVWEIVYFRKIGTSIHEVFPAGSGTRNANNIFATIFLILNLCSTIWRG